jgi:3-isopropylmalate dehydrogenase
MGMLPSASLGEGKRGLYEPIHGSAPDIAGKGVANQLGAIRSLALLLEHLGAAGAAARVEAAVKRTVLAGQVTRDMGGSLSTVACTDHVLDGLRQEA